MAGYPARALNQNIPGRATMTCTATVQGALTGCMAMSESPPGQRFGQAAVALASRGLSVGILDADVYGPSLPTMLGISGQPAYEDGAIIPHQAHGLKAMSVGLLTRMDDAMIWRGPMASQAITQMLTQTRWGVAEAPLDVLVVDLPPGTGDVQLTLIQRTPLDGAVIVSTPNSRRMRTASRRI
jgi:ATP-binding protein involved in chromosome partitioning